jgi:uncharacterized repeat protein (TIGR03803 family)
MYGTAFYGGAHGAGTVFKVGTGELTTLHSFCSRLSHENICPDGQCPVSGLVQAANGNYYGRTTYNGGANGTARTDGCGTIFEITPAGKLTTLYSLALALRRLSRIPTGTSTGQPPLAGSTYCARRGGTCGLSLLCP